MKRLMICNPYWLRVLERAEKKATEYNRKMKEIEEKYSKFPQTHSFLDAKLYEIRQLETYSLKIALLLAKYKKAKN